MCPSSDVRAEAAATVSPVGKSALHTGLRKTEQLSLTWADVDFKAKIITVRQSKSGEPRLIPINSILEETLRKIPQRIDNPFIFAGTKPGERQNDLPKGWERFLSNAGILDFHWHDLRHTFASRLVMKGVDLYKGDETSRTSRLQDDRAIRTPFPEIPQRSSRCSG